MNFKLPVEYKRRIPLVLHYKSNNIYFQQQFNIVGENGQGCKIACQHYKIENVTSLREIGELTISILNKFQKMGDLTLAEFDELMNDPDEQLLFYEGSEYLNFMNIKKVMILKEPTLNVMFIILLIIKNMNLVFLGLKNAAIIATTTVRILLGNRAY